MNRRRAFVLMYAVGVMVLVTSLALSLSDASVSDVQIARQRFYQVLARDAAESGVEYAMGFITRQLARPDGPWKNTNYMFDPTTPPANGTMTQPWFYAARASGQNPAWSYPGTIMTPYNGSLASQAEGPIIRLHRLYADGSDPGPALPTANSPYAQVVQAQISMIPEMTYQNVRVATDARTPTVFHVRSRGEVLRNDGTPNPIVQASTYLIQSFIVAAPDGCPTPRPLRQVLDREPPDLIFNLGQRSRGPIRGTQDYSGGPNGYVQRFMPPNVH